MAIAEAIPESQSISVWSADQFPAAFGFSKVEQGFEKTIGGNRYLFRKVASPKELVQILEVQRLAWGWSETDLAPTHILALMEDTGGGVFGAFDNNGQIVGFAAGFGGGTDGLIQKPTIISSMLAVAGTNYRSGGIGKELKIIQAHDAYLAGYEAMKWFYDPERGENAALNMRKLGARAEEFHINKYGQMDSKTYGGPSVPTDRFRAVWRFNTQAAVDRILGNTTAPLIDEVRDLPIAKPNFLPLVEKVLVEISPDIDSEPEQTKIARRFRLREILSFYFLENRYLATEFISGHQGEQRKNYYLLQPTS